MGSPAQLIVIGVQVYPSWLKSKRGMLASHNFFDFRSNFWREQAGKWQNYWQASNNMPAHLPAPPSRDLQCEKNVVGKLTAWH